MPGLRSRLSRAGTLRPRLGRPRLSRPKRPPTGRAVLLGAVLVFLVVVLASPVHRYLASRSATEQAAQQLESDRTQLGRLQQQQAQWADPAYVEQQARARLQYAMPGDTVYILVKPGDEPSFGGPSRAASTNQTGSTWNRRLWGSVRSADAVP